jgi:uncharacterized protein (DUF305 family)
MRTAQAYYRVALLALVSLAASPGAAEAARSVNLPQPGDPDPVAADVRFMQDMMIHHAQATEMAALVAARTERAEIRRLARRIAISQEDEQALMRRWLEDRGQPVPGPHAHHDGAHAGMPGMVDAADMARLRAARGEAFDRHFLKLMISHHEGALVMVDQLFRTDGAGQETEIFRFATHVESDQRIEIARMRNLLDSYR